jgi:hypothetical protein
VAALDWERFPEVEVPEAKRGSAPVIEASGCSYHSRRGQMITQAALSSRGAAWLALPPMSVIPASASGNR